MTDEKNWNAFGRMPRRPDPERVREFAATARKLQHERESSAEVIDRLLRETPVDEWPRLAHEESLRTSGALERLGKEVAARLEKNPREALALATVATEVADRLPADAYPPVVVAQVRAHAWKDRGQALCYLAKYEDALEALSRAEALLDAFGTLAHDRAVVRFVRATTLRHLDRVTEARALLVHCREVFKDHGDARLELFCGIVEGSILCRTGDAQTGRALYESLLAVAQAIDDRESQARLHSNIGHCCADLGDTDAADKHLAIAAATFGALGRLTEATRAEALRGRVHLRRGDSDAALWSLASARRNFLLNGLVEEAGICGLDQVEALLQAGKADAASDLANEIVQQFTKANLNRRAVMAVAYLREAINARTASTQTAEYVRFYVGELRKNPELEFGLVN